MSTLTSSRPLRAQSRASPGGDPNDFSGRGLLNGLSRREIERQSNINLRLRVGALIGLWQNRGPKGITVRVTYRVKGASEDVNFLFQTFEKIEFDGERLIIQGISPEGQEIKIEAINIVEFNFYVTPISYD